jgi:hypothetical protein
MGLDNSIDYNLHIGFHTVVIHIQEISINTQEV